VPTKEELAYEAKVAQLKELAKEHEVDLEGATTKDDIVEKLVASRKVTREDLAALTSDDEDDSETDDSSKTSTSSSTAEATPAQAAGLVDPAEYARERSGTSDPANREEGTDIADVEPDITVGEKSSDAPDYDFPPGGDVDRALLSAKKHKGESKAPVEIDSIIKLGKNKAVPDDLVGHFATITAKTTDANGKEHFTLRTRDEHNAVVYADAEAFAEVHPGGVGVRGFGP
jgi:hypothetical protein